MSAGKSETEPAAPEKASLETARLKDSRLKDSRLKDTGFEDTGFEEAIGELETLVDRLEHEELDLEDALAVFERGISLSRHCAAKLEAAETRIEVLVREGGDWLERPFEGSREEDEE